ncbi:putative fructokinase-6, chloroplastic isoform X2 [Silene latifolia]|uniref:putative fructokinase-6, chloroplastic isoform X2 n=1 Tax=Silene latifolia TaxID=37657 RepID=UPI003D77E80E
MALTTCPFQFISLSSKLDCPTNQISGPTLFLRRPAASSPVHSFRRHVLKARAQPGNNGPLEAQDSLVVCFGEMLIDFVPTISGLSLAEAPAFKKAPGGAPANVAVGIARLGGSSAFIGKVGEDEFGYMLADILKENNVNSDGMRFDPGARTALAFVTLRKDGEREFMFYRNPSADMLLQESELDFDLITKVSEDEISFLTQGEDPYDDNVVRKLFHPNLKLLLVTEGSEGCRYYTKEFSGRVGGVKVDAVDTTGAGDAFVAGILFQLAADIDLIKNEDGLRVALEFANACGAITVTERGAIPALPTKIAVQNAMLKTVA